jgi:membrane-bound serine protease (ClpP class)
MTALAQAMVDPSIEVLLVADGADEVCMTRVEYEDRMRQSGAGELQIVRTVSPAGQLLNLTAAEAFELGFSDGVVLSREELFEALGIDAPEVLEVLPSWSEKFAGFLDYVKWLLLVAGLVLLYVEMKIPGFGLPGMLGLTCIGLVLVRNYLVGLAEIPEVLLVILGIVLIAIELFVLPGFGVTGIAGIVCVALGVLFSFLPFFWPAAPNETAMLRATIRNFSIALVATLAGAYVLSRYVLPRTPLFGALILDTGAKPATLGGSAATLGEGVAPGAVAPGTQCVAQSDLRPAGKIDVNGTLLDAVTEGEFIPRGSRVTVLAVNANHVVVRAAPRGSA